MGSGIATALVQAGYEVLLKEVNQQFLEVRAPAFFVYCTHTHTHTDTHTCMQTPTNM
jgi:hypothetical protein